MILYICNTVAVGLFGIILSAAFQSLGHSRDSLVISLLRYIVLLLPVPFC